MDSATKAGLSLGGLIAGSTLFVALILGLVLLFDLQRYILQLFEWIDTLGLWAPLCYVLLHALVIIFLVPGVFFTLGAGFLFGPVAGTAVIVVATTLGAAAAFAVARWLLGERTARLLLEHPKARIVNAEICHGGWKVVLLTRLIPFFPFKLSNYVFGLMGFRFRDFVLGTFVGVIPLSFTNVYMGSLAADLATLMAGPGERSALTWALYGIGLAVAIGLVTYLGRRADRALARYQQDGAAPPPGDRP